MATWCIQAERCISARITALSSSLSIFAVCIKLGEKFARVTVLVRAELIHFAESRCAVTAWLRNPIWLTCPLNEFKWVAYFCVAHPWHHSGSWISIGETPKINLRYLQCRSYSDALEKTLLPINHRINGKFPHKVRSLIVALENPFFASTIFISIIGRNRTTYICFIWSAFKNTTMWMQIHRLRANGKKRKREQKIELSRRWENGNFQPCDKCETLR